MFENITRAIVPLAVLFIPVLIGIFTGNLHAWYGFIHGPEPTEEHLKHALARQAPVLRDAVLPRAARALLRRLDRATRSRCGTGRTKQDPSAARPSRRKMHWWAPSGVLLLALTSTFFAFDVLMSLQYTWFSTIFGVYFWVGGIRGSMATVRADRARALRSAGYLRNTITMEHLHDVAKLMFGFTVFWAYIALRAILPDLVRQHAGGDAVLSAPPQRRVVSAVDPAADPVLRGAVLHAVAAGEQAQPALARGLVPAWILLMHAYDLYWQMLPVLHNDTIRFHWMDVAAPVCLFGVVLLATLWGFQRMPLIPIRDARLNETIGYENETP